MVVDEGHPQVAASRPSRRVATRRTRGSRSLRPSSSPARRRILRCLVPARGDRARAGRLRSACRADIPHDAARSTRESTRRASTSGSCDETSAGCSEGSLASRLVVHGVSPSQIIARYEAELTQFLQPAWPISASSKRTRSLSFRRCAVASHISATCDSLSCPIVLARLARDSSSVANKQEVSHDTVDRSTHRSSRHRRRGSRGGAQESHQAGHGRCHHHPGQRRSSRRATTPRARASATMVWAARSKSTSPAGSGSKEKSPARSGSRRT